jgi:hypothetical protein
MTPGGWDFGLYRMPAQNMKDRNGKNSFLQHAPFSLSGEHDTDRGDWGPNARRGLPILPTHVGAL